MKRAAGTRGRLAALAAVSACWITPTFGQSTNPILAATQAPGVPVVAPPVASPYGYYAYPPYPYSPYGQQPYVTNNPSVNGITQPPANPSQTVPPQPSQPGTSLAQGLTSSMGGGGGGGSVGAGSGGQNGAAAQIQSQGPPADANLQLVQDPRSPLYKRYNQLDAAHGPLREQVLLLAAQGVGTRQGFAEELQRINDLLEGTFGRQLARRYDFSQVVIRGELVPPVITELHDVKEEESPRVLYLTIGQFRIVRQARLTASPPDWRHYLYVTATKNFEKPTVYPQNTDEQAIWDQGLASGIATGVNEARITFTRNLDRLARDYDGMVRYKELALKGAVSLPIVDVAKHKVRVGEDGNAAYVGERIVTLKVEPKFRLTKPKAYR